MANQDDKRPTEMPEEVFRQLSEYKNLTAQRQLHAAANREQKLKWAWSELLTLPIRLLVAMITALTGGGALVATAIAALAIGASWQYEQQTGVPQTAGILTFFVTGPIILFVWLLYLILSAKK